MRKNILALLIMLLALLPATASALEVTVKVSGIRPHIMGDYSPGHILDGKPGTSWVSGGVDNGVGAWVKLQFAKPIKVAQIAVLNGVLGGGHYKTFARIKTAELVYPGGEKKLLNFRDTPEEQIFTCFSQETTWFKLVVKSIYPPADDAKLKGVGISGLRLYVPPAKKKAKVAKDSKSGKKDDVWKSAEAMAGARKVLEQFYVWHTTLDDRYLDLVPRDRRKSEEFTFEIFKSYQMQRGTYEVLRHSTVRTDNMKYELMSLKNGLLTVHATGKLFVKTAKRIYTMDEDSIFSMRQYAGEWKIINIQSRK